MSALLESTCHRAGPKFARSTLAGLVACMWVGAASANLLTNESFEQPPGTSYASLPGASGFIAGWTTVLSGVEWYNSAAYGFGAAADGVMVVDLANFTHPSGGLEQSFATTPGDTIDVSFWAGNLIYDGRDGSGIVRVSINGNPFQDFATPQGVSVNTVWEQRSFSFVASNAQTTLRFWNEQNPYLHFALIDGVSAQVMAVPEPAGVAMAGLALLGLAGVRRRITPR